MPYNYSKLKGRIVEKFGNNKSFAKAIGVSERTISLKLNGKVQFTQKEMATITELLAIPINQMQDYFFTIYVQNN